MKVIGRRATVWAIVIGCALVVGCSIAEQFKEMQEDSGKAKAAIESELGGEVQIGWNITNGRVIAVRVAFVKPPAHEADLKQLKVRVTELVTKTFRRGVERVEVSI